MATRKLVRLMDIPFIAGIILAAFLWIPWRDAPGDTVVIEADGEAHAFPLHAAQIIELKSHGIHLQIEIADGAVAVTQSDCPDKICLRTGAITRAGGTIVCVPARVVITIAGDGHDYDAITG